MLLLRRCTPPSQQLAVEWRAEILLQILHLSVQPHHPLISASPGLSIQQTLATDSNSPLVLLQTLHFLLPSSTFSVFQTAAQKKQVHCDVREGWGLLTSNVRGGGVLWASSLTDTTGPLRATILLRWPTMKLSLTPLLYKYRNYFFLLWADKT